MKPNVILALVMFSLGLISAIAVVTTLGTEAPEPPPPIVMRDLPEELQGVGVTDMRGNVVPGDLTFVDADGKNVKTASWFDGTRPVALVLSYYDCPLLCPRMMNAVQETLNELEWMAGEEFRVITASFDHTDTTADAALKQATYLAGYKYRRDMPVDGWRFYTTDATNARALSESVGFHYKFLPEVGEFSHTSAMFFLTPHGELTTFIEHIDFDPTQVRLSLQDASGGKAGSLFEQITFNCFYLDPTRNEYLIHPMTVMKLGAGGTAVLVFGALGTLFLTLEVKSMQRRKLEAGG